MTTGRHSQVFQQLRQAVLAHESVGLTDADLMSRFVAQRDGAALEALIRRHASMVWSVSRRVLSNEQDAEDAFQASFLVFVRKGPSLPARSQVGNWLYGVAYRTALKARSVTARRREKERRAAAMTPTQTQTDESWTEWLPRLDQELARLPEKYRTAIVLCELEGRPRREAARQLGIPEGTLSSRLATGRRMLAKRLGRPGLALSAGALATSAVVPPTLMASTVKAVSLIAAGQVVVSGVVSARAASLAEGVIKAMLLTRISAGAVLLAVVAVLAAGTGTVVYCEPAGRADPKPPTPPVAAVAVRGGNVDKEKEESWGEAVEGVQARLRPAKAKWDEGAAPEFTLDLRNRGERRLSACQLDLFCEIELDGKWYMHSPFLLAAKRIWLEPGKQIDGWTVVSLAGDSWVRKTPGRKINDPIGDNDERLQFLAGKHTLRVAYLFEDGPRPKSQPVEIVIGKESIWGEAVDGVQARIRIPKAVWGPNEAPTFHFDLRNQGKTTPNARRAPLDCEMEVDKVWYSYEEPAGPYPPIGDLFKPGEQVNGWTILKPDIWRSFTSPRQRQHVTLAPGKHTVRIAFRFMGEKALRPISGPLEIEASEKPDDAKETMDGYWEAASLEQDARKKPKPITASFRDGHYHITNEFGPQGAGNGTVVIHPETDPKSFELIPDSGLFKDKAFRGIFLRDEEALTLCFSWPVKDRPTEFRSPPNSTVVLVVFKSEKP